MSQIVSGEAVPVDLRPARVGSRLVAALIDLTVQVVGLVLLTLLLSATLAGDLDGAAFSAVLTVIYVGVLVGYPVAWETLSRGRTPGKAAMGLRVVRADGGPLRFRHALARGVVGLAERPGPLLGAPAVICMMTDRRARRLGDLLAGSVVLQERVPVSGPIPPMPPSLAGWATTLDLGGLPDGLALSAREFLARAPQLSPGPREQIGAELVAAVQAVVAPPPPPGTPGWAYIAAVLGERRRRDQMLLGGPPAATPAPVRPPTATPPNVSPPAVAPPPAVPPATSPQPSPQPSPLPGQAPAGPFAPPG